MGASGAKGGAEMGGALGGLAGLFVGDALGGPDREKQEREVRRLRALYASIPVELRAEMEDPYLLGPSASEQISEDPLLRAEQLRTLQSLRALADAGGLDAGARADLAQAQAATAGQERAQRGNILDAFARGGQRNSNAALLAALSAQQGSAQRAGMEGLQAAGDASARRYRAMLDAGNLAGGVRSQDFGVASARAGAADRVSEYNAAARNAAIARNTERKMAAQRGTIDNRFRQAEGLSGATQQQLALLDARQKRLLGLGEGAGAGIGTAVGGAIGGGM